MSLEFKLEVLEILTFTLACIDLDLLVRKESSKIVVLEHSKYRQTQYRKIQ